MIRDPNDEAMRRNPRPDARREPPHAIEHPGRSIGSSADPSYRRGLHEGAVLALRLADEGWTREELIAWLDELGEWRFDPDAGELPPSPRKDGGR